MRKYAFVLAVSLVFVLAVLLAEASPIIDRTTITAYASSYFVSGGDQRVPAKLLDGLLCLTGGEGGSTEMWLNAGDAQPGGKGAWASFDLGKPYSLDTLKIWNDNSYNDGGAGFWMYRGMKYADIQTAASLADFNAGNFTTIPGLANITIPEGKVTLQTADDYGLVTFPADTVAQYVRIYCETNYDDEARTYVGLSEVQFTGVVPEPATFSLLALAAFAARFLLRRR